MADTLVLIHGANGSHVEMQPLAARMPDDIETFTPDWLGHGGRPPPGDDYDMHAVVDDLVRSLDRAKIERCFLFGYSIGGYAALMIAHRHPERVRGVITFATRHLWHARGVAHVVHLADPARLTRPGNTRAAELAATHHPTDWHLVNGANRRLFAMLGANTPLRDADLRAIAVPVLVLNGSRDPLVPESESRALASLFSTWRLGLFDGSAHPFWQTPLDDIATATAGFVRDVAALER